MTIDDLESRVRRLEHLSLGLSKEVVMWKGADTPLLYVERKEYLNAIQDALAGVEQARVALAQVVHRLQASRESKVESREL